MGQQKVTNVHLHFPAAYCPFGPNCMFLKNTSATKICNVQTKVSVCSSFVTASIYYGITLMHPVLSADDTLSLPSSQHFAPLLKIIPSF